MTMQSSGVNLTEMVTSLCQHHVLHQGWKKQLRGVFRRRCVFWDKLSICPSRMQSWQNCKVLWLGIPLLNIKIRWQSGILAGVFRPPIVAFQSWVENKSLKISIPFLPCFQIPQIELNEDLTHLQSNPEPNPLKNSNFLNSQTSKPQSNQPKFRWFVGFLGSLKMSFPTAALPILGADEKVIQAGWQLPTHPKRITRHLWKLTAGSGKKFVVCI